VADDDTVVADKDLLDEEAHDTLALDDVECIGSTAQASEERRKIFCKSQEIGAVVGLIRNRLQLGAQRLFALA
jgi:hypothetical protein